MKCARKFTANGVKYLEGDEVPADVVKEYDCEAKGLVVVNEVLGGEITGTTPPKTPVESAEKETNNEAEPKAKNASRKNLSRGN